MQGRRRLRVLVAVVVAAVVGTFVMAAPAGAIGSPPSVPIGARIKFAQTNGDILAITKIAGAGRDLIAFGGNFTAVITPDGVSRAARNFAVVDEFTGALVYAGNANSYVRSLTSWNGVVYAGGDFTSFSGVGRNRAAAVSSANWAVTGWNPSPGYRIFGMIAGTAGVYIGGGGPVRATNATTGATAWSQSVSGGDVRSLGISPSTGWLYVGGLFEVYGGLTRHGLVRVNPLSGAPDAGFNANLRVDSGVGSHGSYDGQAGSVIQFTNDGSRLGLGLAGYGSDGFRVINPTTGSQIWQQVLPGDCQGVGIVGSTYVVGYHRHDNNPWPYFAAQLEANGTLTTFNPGVTGYQSNADGGNNGVQAIYSDQANGRLFLAGAFTSPVKSLAVYPFTPTIGGGGGGGGGGGNQSPTASFTAAASGLTASFNGSGSSDPDGSIASWAWTFGDGTTGSGATVQHTYASAGTYAVTLKVTDNQGATATASATVTVPPPVVTTFAADSFTRTVSGGFGSADVGGPWTMTGAPSRFSVSGGAGRMAIPPGSAVRADLLNVQQTSADVSSTFSVNAAPSGGGTFLALVGRRVDAANDYRVKVRLLSNGTVAAQLVRVVGGVETAVQTVFTVPGVSYASGNVLHVRFRVSGTGTTALAAKIWKDGTAEPSSWLMQASDSTSSLQRAGAIGYWYYLSTASTQNPTVLSVDNLSAGPAA